MFMESSDDDQIVERVAALAIGNAEIVCCYPASRRGRRTQGAGGVWHIESSYPGGGTRLYAQFPSDRLSQPDRLKSNEADLRRSLMGQQSVRQAARREALGVQASRREARARRERRLDQLAVELHTALGERDAAVTAIERRAGEVLQAMTSDEGLTLREAVDWCGGLTLKEASRLLRMAPDEADPIS